MTPTPPSPEDDILDLDGLGGPAPKPKASTQESDFEKELEALFAEDLAQAEAEAAAKKPAAPAPAVDDQEALLLQDILGEDTPASAPVASPEPGEDVLDLSSFAAAEAAPEAQDDDVLDLSAFSAAEAPEGDDDALDLSAFAADGPLDLTPPADTAGGKDGGVDIEGLDSLISELAPGAQAPAPEPELPPMDAPLDGIDIHGDDDVLDVPLAVSQPAAEAAFEADEALELGLDDLLAEPRNDVLDLTLPDLSEPEPGAVLSALDDTPAFELAAEPAPAEGQDEAADLAAAALSMVDEDLGVGIQDLSADDLNLTLPVAEPLHTDVSPDDILGAGGLEAGGVMEGFDAHMPEVASEVSLDAGTLLEQVDAEAALGAAAAAAAVGAAAVAVAAMPGPEPAPAPSSATQVILTPEVLAEMQKMLSELKHQVLGGSVTVVGMQGQLAEKDQIITSMEERLRLAEEEATALREELAGLRSVLEEDGRTSTQVKERLALLEDRQAQMDQDMRAEIERAVPREAAKVIREEIAALADSMRD